MKLKLKIKNKKWMNYKFKIENCKDNGKCNRFKINN